ncbi:hypothetical protein DRJ16_05235 [Candidatus Woesearchaeota archaeon]|nr:MAG: hypothetical protein DRJ16_05235 [Candidatus Woesearchaeota archaeon]
MEEIIEDKPKCRHEVHLGLELMAACAKLILTLNDIIKKLLTPRSIIAFALYGAFVKLTINGKISEQAITAVVSAMMGHYFGEQSAKKQMEAVKNVRDITGHGSVS